MPFTRLGFGQVEPNQLSAQKTGQIYASLPLNKDVEVLENGQFMYYDYKSGTVTADGVGEPMLVFNEIKIYEDYLRLKDFAMIRVGDNYVTNPAAVGRVTQSNYGWAEGAYKDPDDNDTPYGDGSFNKPATIDPEHSDYQAGKYRMDGFAPRLFKTNIGDIFTTNMVETGVEYQQGETLKLKKVKDFNNKGDVLVLAKNGAVSDIEFVIAKVYTMPDGQPGLKLQRIK